MKIVYDIEADGLLTDCTKVHTICAYNLDTDEEREWLAGDLSWKQYFSKATMIIGHNIMGYDNVVLEKLFGFVFPNTCKVFDTMIYSKVLNYRRFGYLGHSLENWGRYLGNHKIDWRQKAIELGLIEEDEPEGAEFRIYHPEMSEYCKQDVRLNTEVYHILVRDYLDLFEKKREIKTYIRAEHATARWCALAEWKGWPFDMEKAKELKETLQKKVNQAMIELTPKLGLKCVAVDRKNGIVEEKYPKWIQNGCYDAHTANWFKISPLAGLDDPELNGTPGHRPVLGPYSRVLFVPLLLSSVQDVKIFLTRNGWIPTTWNYKTNPQTRRKEKTTPKITEDSLEFLGGDGKLYKEYAVANSRLNNLITWMESVDEFGNLHGKCNTIGTPSMRATHSVIVNVPSGERKKDGTAVSPYGPEMRALFTAIPGWKVIGCDSSGNQARGLAFYLKNEEFINTLLNGDIHQYNADKLTEVLKNDLFIDHVVPRAGSKRVFYAFLFGASGEKLWSYIFGVPDSKKGKQLKEGFLKAVPGFSELVDKLMSIYKATVGKGREGHIFSLAGNKIFVDSPHKLLVYLLQSLEKITCSTALMLTMEELERRKIPYRPLIFMHDEIQFMVPERYAEIAKEIGAASFKKGPELYGINIMDGAGKIGNNWEDTH